MVKNKINYIDNEDGERVINLLCLGDGYNGHYNAFDLVIKRKAPVAKKKLPGKLAKTCFKLTYKCAVYSKTLQLNSFFMGTLSEMCYYCNASHFKVEKNSIGRSLYTTLLRRENQSTS